MLKLLRKASPQELQIGKVPWTCYVLNFMEKNPEIPSELYGRWWKVINDEFGEIITDEDQISRGAENTNPLPISST